MKKIILLAGMFALFSIGARAQQSITISNGQGSDIFVVLTYEDPLGTCTDYTSIVLDLPGSTSSALSYTFYYNSTYNSMNIFSGSPSSSGHFTSATVYDSDPNGGCPSTDVDQTTVGSAACGYSVPGNVDTRNGYNYGSPCWVPTAPIPCFPPNNTSNYNLLVATSSNWTAGSINVTVTATCY